MSGALDGLVVHCDRVKVTGARAIVVYHLDRFARDLAATLDYLRRFARRGVELHVAPGAAPRSSIGPRSNSWPGPC